MTASVAPSVDGRFVEQEPFVRALRPPVKAALAQRAGAAGSAGAPLVYMGQQVCPDHGSSVVAKLAALAELRAEHGVQTCALWADTDRAGSDRRMTTITWPRGDSRVSLGLAPAGAKRVEPRFITVDGTQLRKAADRLWTLLHEAGVTDTEARERFRQVRCVLERPGRRTLAEVSLELTELLLSAHGMATPPVTVSSLLEDGDFVEEVEATLNALPRVVAVFNAAVADLRRRGIDPLVRPLADDYLPLRVTCTSDGSRLALRRHSGIGGTYAVARCRCGRTHRFLLGRDQLSIRQLVESRRWSPDVLLPVFVNDLVSGVVAGRSSARYGLVLDRVVRDALGARPVPVLVPAGLGRPAGAGGPGRPESLLAAYLHGD